MRSLDEPSLAKLLSFIRGGDRALLGVGIWSYIERDKSNDLIHEACLELEKRGLIHRYPNGCDSVFWMPTHPEPAEPHVFHDV